MRVVLLIAAFTAVAFVVQSAGADTPRGFAFGGNGPHGAYVVQVSADGSIHASGAEGLTRSASQIALSQLVAFDRRATRMHFGSFPAYTRCIGATRRTTTWIRIGSKKVTVAGTCFVAYQQLWKAVVTATRFYVSGY